MIIPITKPLSSQQENGEPIEWAMIELNGELVLPEANDDTPLDTRGMQQMIELGLLRFQNVSLSVLSVVIVCLLFTPLGV